MSLIALKRLTASDLTFFEWHHRNRPSGNQKAINLNAAVFVDEFFPTVETVAEPDSGRLPLDTYFYGPGGHGPLNLQRKIVKSHKNWRLNGEFIHNPAETPERFNVLVPGDLAVLEFFGDIAPRAVRVFLVAQGEEADRALHTVLDSYLGDASMRPVELGALLEVLSAIGLDENHSLNELLLEEQLVDAALGGARGLNELWARRSTRRTTPAELRRYRDLTSRIGRRGEQLVNDLLESHRATGQIANFEWIALENAVAPYDFLVRDRSHETTRVEVKSTRGPFKGTLHFSLAELIEMADERDGYRVYRIFEMTEDSAQLRIAADCGPFAKEVLQTLTAVPRGVRVDSMSFSPSVLEFGDMQPVSSR